MTTARKKPTKTKRKARISKVAKTRRKTAPKRPALGSGGRFAELSAKIAARYRRLGYSPAQAEKIARATAASIGRRKYGSAKMASMAKAGKRRRARTRA